MNAEKPFCTLLMRGQICGPQNLVLRPVTSTNAAADVVKVMSLDMFCPRSNNLGVAGVNTY